MDINELRDDRGQLPAYAWPGGAHTPGPWKAMAGPPEYARIDSADERDIARCPRKENTTRAEANAYLVAAAPDLLLTLETIEAATDGLSSGLAVEINRSAKAVIQKARGEK